MSLSTLNLDLPGKAPTESYSHESHNTDKLAIYLLVDLEQDGINALLRALENDNENLKNAYKLSKKYDFTGSTLKDVYDYHLQLGREKTHHPTLFIVAYRQKYEDEGVLLVNLNIDLQGGVDTCRLKPADALLAGVNLEIGNMDWEDYKEDELALTHAKSSDDESASQRDQPTSRLAGQKHNHHLFGAYGVASGANMTAIRGLLEPDWQEKDPKDWVCEAVCSYTDFSEPLNEVVKWHPWNCLRNPRLHRQWFICIDGSDPQEKGVLLVHITWDGDINQEPNRLLCIGPEADVTTERVSVETALTTLEARDAERETGA